MIEFELLSRENIDKVYELEKRCFDDPWTFNMFESELDNKTSVYIVGKDEQTNEVICYAGVWLMYDMADITNIAVDHPYRREGLGGIMLKILTDICKEHGIERICLEVKESNISAINLYKKYGFEQDGIRKRYYKNNEDAVLMSKKIV